MNRRGPDGGKRANRAGRDIRELCLKRVLTVPPLRERKEDVPVLAHHFLYTSAYRFRLGGKADDWKKLSIGADGLRALMDYTWPGNVRELQMVINQAIIRYGAVLIGGSPEDRRFTADHFDL